jgi:hypothetical protein
VIKQRSDRLPVRLTDAVVRGNTNLRVGIGGHVVRMHRDRQHTVSRVVGRNGDWGRRTCAQRSQPAPPTWCLAAEKHWKPGLGGHR